MTIKVIIVGAFHEIIELAEELNIKILGLIDKYKTGSYLTYPILGNDNDAIKLQPIYKKVSIIITPDQPEIRHYLSNHYENLGYNFISLISKSTKISKSAKIDCGAIIQHNVNISSEALIGKFVKLNTGCNIMHNSIIQDFTTIAPNAVILGNVRIGKCCYIGSNSTILPNIEICDNVIVGAGAVVTKNIAIPGTYKGIPAIISSNH